MQRVFLFVSAMVFAASTASAVDVALVQQSAANVPGFVGYAPDRIVVQFESKSVAALDRSALPRGRTGLPELDRLGTLRGVSSIRPQFPGAVKKFLNGREVDLSGWHKVKFAAPIDALAVAAEYRKMPGVVDAQPVSIHAAYATANDPFFSDGSQWHLPWIKAPQAWDTETGSSGIIVAVPDTGVRYFGRDLGGSATVYSAGPIPPATIDGNVWTNASEKNGTTGSDDDGNGKIDDWYGWDFVESTEVSQYIICTAGEDCSAADNDPRDFNGHGTHCAGSVAALTNNGYGVASVAGGWGNGTLQPTGNGVKVMSLRIGWQADYYFFWQVGLVAMDYAAEALYYAANNGARIATCSWGSEDTGGIGAAIDYFVAHGGLIFKAAGNDGGETADYLCSRGDVICVAATDSADCKATFSTYGSWVDVSAPGVGILSLYHLYTDPAGEYVTYMDGTSMASPLAASVAALIWSLHPAWTAAQVKDQLFASADPIDSLSCNASFAGKLGAGRINASNAVGSTVPTPQPPAAPTDLAAAAASSSRINLAWTDNSDNEDDFRIERCSGSDCNGFVFIAIAPANSTGYGDTSLQAGTTYRYRVYAHNSVGASGYSNTAGATTPAAATVPAAPTNLKAMAVSGSQIRLTWGDNSANEAGFRIERCAGSKCTNFQEITSVGANVVGYQDTGLASRTSFRYRVRAYNAVGNSAYSNIAGAKTFR